METLDLDPSFFPVVQESQATRGVVRNDLAGRFGLNGVEVAAGGADNAASALGVGALTPGEVMVSVGTSGTVLAVTTARKPDPSGRLHFFSHAAPSSRYYMGVMLAAASALSFFTDKMGKKVNWTKLNPCLEQVPPGAGGMMFLPYLNGERTPHRDPDARGALVGLSQQSDWPHILRAVMEGVTFGLRDNFELIKERSEVRRIWLVGGGAKNPVWRKILAANFRQSVQTPVVDEGGAYGAAMLAALGDGLDLAAVSTWVKPQFIEEPDPALAEFYDQWYPEFQNLYQDLKGRFKRLAR
jgi:xylulokinase